MTRHIPIGRQAAIRLLVSLGLLIALIAVVSIGIYRAALNKAAQKRAEELVSFYTTRLDQIEQDWEIRSRDFKVRIEVTRALENPATAQTNLQAFMTIQSADRPFQAMLIEGADGSKLFEFGKAIGLPSIPPSANEKFAHYLDPDDHQLYRVFQYPIWLGEKHGMGRFAVFFRIDNALLSQMVTPGLTLSVLDDGKVLASSGGQIAIDRLRRELNSADKRKEAHELPWSGQESDAIRLFIEAPVSPLFSNTELTMGMSVIPIVDGLVLWFTLGLWLMRQTRRITRLGDAVSEYAGAGQVTPAMTATLADARQGRSDEIAAVANALGSMVAAIDRREQERKEFTEQLRQSEARIREVTSTLADGVMVVDTDGAINFVNPRAEQLLGWNAGELLGKDSYATLQHQLTAEQCQIRDAIHAGKEYHAEGDVVRTSGNPLPIVLTATPIRRDGGVAGAVVTFHDISERQATQRALKDSERRFRQLFNTGGDAIFVVEHPTLRLIEVNEIACQRLGYSREQLLAMTAADIDDPASIGDMPEVIQQLETTGRALFRRQHIASDGRRIPVEIVAQTMEFAGKPAIMSVARDISDRLQAEAEYQTIVATTHDAFWVVSVGDGRLIDVNPAACAMVGHSRAEMLTMGISDIEAAEHPQNTRQHIDAIIEGREERFESRHRHKDGHLVDVEISAKFVAVRGGVLVAFIRDITARKATELALRKATSAAELANKAKSEFLANMSHEIRTPLHVITGLGHLLRRDLADPVQQLRVDQLCTSSEHLLAIINDVLDLSKIEAEQLVLDQSYFRLDTVVNNVVRMVEERAYEKGLMLATDVPSRLRSIALNGDALRLTQVLINLCSNAVKFTNQGEVSLGIRCIEANAANLSLRFSVEDTGIGIAPAEQVRLFQPFTQGDNSTTREHGGTGLGLAISQRLVALMGGSIQVDSQMGAGSTFSFQLVVPRAKKRMLKTVESPPVHATTDFHGRRVLFAEDHPLGQEIIFEMLEHLGCEADAASDGAEAVACAQARTYDLILMDMQMPIMDGLAATRAIRALPSHRNTPIIALTANAFADDRQRCLDAGMDGHIGKPVTPVTLATALGQWLPNIAVANDRTPPCDNELSLALQKIPGLDASQALRSSPTQLADYCELLNRFLKLHGQDMAPLRRHLAADEYDAAHVIAHNLKGIAGLLGAQRVASFSNDIVQELRSGADVASITSLATLCEAELTRLAEAVSTLPALPAEAVAA